MISIAGSQRRIQRALTSPSPSGWLLKLGWNGKEVKRGFYQDGHEREDITAYRQNIFVPRIQALTTRMIEWDDSLEPISTVLEPDTKPGVFVTHDKCTFNSNDGRKQIWIHKDHAPICTKGGGQGLHVSDFLTPVGRLGGGVVCEILKCSGDVWWTDEHMLKQLIDKEIPAFEAAFPGCQGVFAFDNAKIHQKHHPDALQASNVKLTPGGKNTVLIRNGYFSSLDNPNAVQVQTMILPHGRLKGLKIILQECGL